MQIALRDNQRSRIRHYTRTIVAVTWMLAVGKVAVAQEEPKQQKPFPSAVLFQTLWGNCIQKSDLAQASSTLEKFKVAVTKEESLSPEARKVLSGLSLDLKHKISLGLADHQKHPALGALLFIALPTALSGPATSVSRATHELDGRVAEHIEYGYFQRGYDSYLSDSNTYSNVTARVRVPEAPELDPETLTSLRTIFAQVNDKEWETKILRWQLGREVDLISPETAPLWARLGQLEGGVFGELDRFLSQASEAKAGIPPERPSLDETIINGGPPVPLTSQQGIQIVGALCDMKMPWEAYFFLQDAKKKWNFEPPGMLSHIKECWAKDISAPSIIWQRALSRPWFIATVKVTPETKWEEFTNELVQRPNLGSGQSWVDRASFRGQSWLY
ncbi:hypothetical protein IAD21_03622 [Abditibacteriota bacterium]|nr:hypothetical protein IAD21_03622 [Abditibacteriota bacterium]